MSLESKNQVQVSASRALEDVRGDMQEVLDWVGVCHSACELAAAFAVMQ